MEHCVTMKVMYTTGRGYYLSVPASFSPLPPQFTQSVSNKKTISCSTEQLTSLSDRAVEAITQALTLTHELTQELLGKIRVNMQCLFSITDCVALLDMLASFVDLVAMSPHPYSRPLLASSESGSPLVIKSGRHPVISSQCVHQLTSTFVSNDLFMSSGSNMHIITGPNGSGKVIILKSVVLVLCFYRLCTSNKWR